MTWLDMMDAKLNAYSQTKVDSCNVVNTKSPISCYTDLQVKKTLERTPKKTPITIPRRSPRLKETTARQSKVAVPCIIHVRVKASSSNEGKGDETKCQ